MAGEGTRLRKSDGHYKLSRVMLSFYRYRKSGTEKRSEKVFLGSLTSSLEKLGTVVRDLIKKSLMYFKTPQMSQLKVEKKFIRL